ncbi:hypothetical protein BCR36DRAFT_374367 [Piromyces finnis]|uniref:Uncharacterized protein n=1 Tax=Piromyces finnis TaxID=1754191 RepID=A0A1Y1UWW0_9FUNG|nr:hypothetical protein BCR36DRAFT_374367 [Piromyces finnis]|eukprot:ORX42638.1 hypothetical protein BCR36DRAFT_374367 [Piromyces finnis]
MRGFYKYPVLYLNFKDEESKDYKYTIEHLKPKLTEKNENLSQIKKYKNSVLNRIIEGRKRRYEFFIKTCLLKECEDAINQIEEKSRANDYNNFIKYGIALYKRTWDVN